MIEGPVAITRLIRVIVEQTRGLRLQQRNVRAMVSSQGVPRIAHETEVMRIEHDARKSNPPQNTLTTKDSLLEIPGEHRQGKRHRHPFINASIEVRSEEKHEAVVHEALNNLQLSMQRAVPPRSLQGAAVEMRVEIERLTEIKKGNECERYKRRGLQMGRMRIVWRGKKWQEVSRVGRRPSGEAGGSPCDVIDKQKSAWPQRGNCFCGPTASQLSGSFFVPLHLHLHLQLYPIDLELARRLPYVRPPNSKAVCLSGNNI